MSVGTSVAPLSASRPETAATRRHSDTNGSGVKAALPTSEPLATTIGTLVSVVEDGNPCGTDADRVRSLGVSNDMTVEAFMTPSLPSVKSMPMVLQRGAGLPGKPGTTQQGVVCTRETNLGRFASADALRHKATVKQCFFFALFVFSHSPSPLPRLNSRRLRFPFPARLEPLRITRPIVVGAVGTRNSSVGGDDCVVPWLDQGESNKLATLVDRVGEDDSSSSSDDNDDHGRTAGGHTNNDDDDAVSGSISDSSGSNSDEERVGTQLTSPTAAAAAAAAPSRSRLTSTASLSYSASECSADATPTYDAAPTGPPAPGGDGTSRSAALESSRRSLALHALLNPIAIDSVAPPMSSSASSATIGGDADVAKKTACGGGLKTRVAAAVAAATQLHRRGSAAAARLWDAAMVDRAFFVLGPNNPVRLMCARVVHYRYFESVVFSLVAYSALMLALDEPRKRSCDGLDGACRTGGAGWL